MQIIFFQKQKKSLKFISYEIFFLDSLFLEKYQMKFFIHFPLILSFGYLGLFVDYF